MTMINFCLKCGKGFKTSHSNRKNCSYECANTRFKKGIRVSKSTEFKKEQIPWSKKHPTLMPKGDDNHEWKGDKVGYSALHMWIRKWYGKPMKCEYKKCIYPRLGNHKKIINAPKRFTWANISHKYKRERQDWIQLCSSCHTLYDNGKLFLI